MGGKYTLFDSDKAAIAVALRAGILGHWSNDEDDIADNAYAYYGSAAIIAEGKIGVFRPRIAFNAQPTRVKVRPNDSMDPAFSFNTQLYNATATFAFRMSRFEIGPFVNTTQVRGPQVIETGNIVTYGVSMGLIFGKPTDKKKDSIAPPPQPAPAYPAEPVYEQPPAQPAPAEQPPVEHPAPVEPAPPQPTEQPPSGPPVAI